MKIILHPVGNLTMKVQDTSIKVCIVQPVITNYRIFKKWQKDKLEFMKTVLQKGSLTKDRGRTVS